MPQRSRTPGLRVRERGGREKGREGERERGGEKKGKEKGKKKKKEKRKIIYTSPASSIPLPQTGCAFPTSTE
jgi:hypothetical protein